MYLSRLKIIGPQMNPAANAAWKSSKMVKVAYPAEIPAKKPVNKTIPPMPEYLFHSEGVFFKM